MAKYRKQRTGVHRRALESTGNSRTGAGVKQSDTLRNAVKCRGQPLAQVAIENASEMAFQKCSENTKNIEKVTPKTNFPQGMQALKAFADWYTQNRAGDCEPSTVRKMKASLTQFVKYCKANETIQSVDDVTEQMAFRFQLARLKNKAVATAGKDVKVLKTAFSYGMKAGQVESNPFANLKAGSDVNEDGQQIVPVSEYELLVNACPNSTWRAILALARLGGLRCPSELTNLRWTDVNWAAKTLRITSPKTKRYGKTERLIPLFERLDRELSDHWDLTAGKSDFVIDLEHLRRTGVSLSTRFKDICVAAGLPEIQNPFRNMRLSAANDVCRLPGVTPKTICDWFGHDMKTALKHYHKTTRQDFEQAVKSDPFVDRVMARPVAGGELESWMDR